MSIVVLLVFGLFGTAAPMQIAELGEDTALPLPDGWSLNQSNDGFPYRLVHFDDDAEMTVHQSILTDDEIITGEDDFRASVDSVINGVVLALPDARLISNTGLKEDQWAAFALEFESWDPDVMADLRHRLAGVIYYHPDGYQLLFTLWARTTPSMWPMLVDDIKLMQNGFVYLGPASDNPLGGDGDEVNWIFLIVPLLGIGIAQAFRARVRRRMSRKAPTAAVPAPSSD